MKNRKTKSSTLISAKPTSENEWTIHSLNIQGTFFERWCQNVIKEQTDWEVLSANYPVEFPKHSGNLLGEQSTLDIRAHIKKKTVELALLIECKKNNPEFINWVFFPHHKLALQEANMSVQLIANQSEKDDRFNWKTSSMISNMISLKWIPTSDAWETRASYLDYKKDKKTKTSNTAITSAAHQIALAARSIFQEEISHNETIRAKIANAEMPYSHQIFIPIIVTTANLFVCNFDPKDINPKTGEIPYSKATLKKQPYLLYEYPLPAHLHNEPLDKIAFVKMGKPETFTRMDILVVNSEYLSALLGKLADNNT